MAGYNLGSATIQVVPSVRGLTKGIEQPLAKSGERASKGMSGKLFGGLKAGALGAGVAVGGILGASVTKGFQRLSAIEQAEAKLKGLGHSGKEVSSIMDNALASVKGTAFGLDEAATLSGTLVASGIKPGKELEKTLKLTADSATIAGKSLDDMGLIWGSVAAKGKLQGDDAMQLLASGVPIWQMVGDVMGKTAGEAQALGSKGQVSFEIFQKAMEKGVGGAALKAGDTTVGAFKNMNAALGRFGASLLKGVFPLIGPAFKGLTGWIDTANDAIGPMVENFTNGVKGIYDVLAKGDFTGAKNMFGLQEDSKFVDVLFTIRDAAKQVGPVLKDAFGSIDLGPVWGALSPIVDGFKQLAPVALQAFQNLSPLGNIFKIIAPTLPQIGQALGQLAGTLAGVLQSALAAVLPAITQLMGALGPIWANLMATVVPAILSIANAIASAVQPIVAAVGPLLSSVIGALIPVISTIVGTVGPLVAMLAGALAPILVKVGEIVGALVAALSPLVTALIGMVSAVLKPLLAVLSTLISAALAVLTPILNAILWVVQALVPVIGFLAGVLGAVANVIGTVLGTALSWLNGVLQGMVPFLTTVFVGAWNGIKVAIGAVAGWVTGTVVPALAAAWQAIASAAQWLYRNVILPVWQGIKVAIAIVVAAVTVYVKAWVAIFKAVVAPVFLWLYRSIIKPVWSAIKTAIGAVVAWFRDTAWPIMKKIVSVIGSVFKWLYGNVIKPVWSAIKTAIGVVVGWFRDTVAPIFKKVVGAIKWTFDNFVRGLKIIWSAIKNRIIAPVVGWFRDTVAPIFKKVVGYIYGRFLIFRNNLLKIWDAIKNKAVKPVVDWFSSTVKPKIDTFVDNLKTGFKGLKKSILNAWDGIKSGMKKPINGIINIYREHIKTPFNSVINKILGGKAGKKWNLPDMQPFATGGWTGPGSRLQPAGVVHADEFVVKKSSRRGIEKQAPGFLDQLNTHGARALTRMGMGYASGGRVLHGYKDIESIPHTGVSVTSTVRKGARTAGTGSVSKHAKGYAVDFAGTAQAMKEFFNYVRSNYKVSELIHTPMGGKQLSRGGIPKAHFPAKTAQMHYNHVHVGGYEPGEKQGAGTSGAGGGLFDNPFTGLWKKISSKVSSTAGEGALGGLLTGVTKKVVGSAKDFVGKKISEAFDFVGDTWDSAKAGAKGVLSKAKASWWATKALVHTGDFNGTNLSSLLRRMNQESGFQVGAQNNWDSNAAKGQASRGLMQVIPSTFAAYRDKSLPNDIFDPLANIVASINYTKSRYGSLTRGWDRKGGYAAGGYTGPGPRLAAAGIVHADEFVLRSEAQRSISKVAPGFLDRLNRMGAGAIGYAKGGLVGYASGGKVSPTAKIGSSKVTVLLEGLSGTEKQVTSAAGKLADGIVKVFNDRMKAAKTTTVNKLSDSLSSLKKEASALKKSISATTSKSKKNTVNRLVDDLAALRKQQSTLKATAREVSKVTKVTGKTKTGKLITKTVTSSTAAAKKAAKDLKGVQKQIDSTQSALTRARRGDYSGAAAAATKRLKSVQAEIDKTDKALKAARRGDYQNAALLKGTKAYNKYAAGAVSKLESYAARTDTLTAKLKTANTKLSDAQKLWTDYRSSMVEKFQGTYALSEESATTGIETIIRGFKNGAATVTTFSSQLQQLRSKGLSGGLVDQIAQMGAESGSKVAKNLLTGSSSQIKEITKQYNALNSASTTSGTSLADQMYRNGVNSAKGLVKGLESQLANVEKASETLANTVLATVRKKLGIHSPSRELDSDGQNSAIGYGNGVYKQIPYAQKALAEMVATPDMSGLRDVGRAEMRPAAQIRAYTPVAGGSEPSVVYQFGDSYGHDPSEIASEVEKKRRRQLALAGF
ncbi:tape measure protein [Brachybacterium halotolerans subsp. kimchii]|uniref:tape measure protein n=1 Tax=Brachybacterium halotolerans TaxID=2795215 RepID=UPI001E48C841|nr:tape measure protein [Brachybacterium halotolerans]UEJ84016.1 tape measure protein [Brachybacterium halotolerans subsp. kimchii]